MIDQRVEQRVGGGHLHGPVKLGPRCSDRRQCIDRIASGPAQGLLLGVGEGCRVTQHEAERHALARTDDKIRCQRSAWVQAGPAALAQRVRNAEPAGRVEEFRAITGPLGHTGGAAQGQKRGMAAEAGAVLALLCEQDGQGVAFPGDHTAPVAATGSQLPLHQPEGPQAQPAAALVAQPHVHDLGRQQAVCKESRFNTQALPPTLEHAVALAVAHLHAAAGAGRGKNLSTLQVLQQPVLRRRVGDRVVGPGSELVQTAVDGPGVAGARLRHLKTETGIGDHIDPRPCRRLPGRQFETEFAARGIELARGTGEGRLGCRRGIGLDPGRRKRRDRRTGPDFTHRGHLHFQGPAVRREDHARQAVQGSLFRRRHLLLAQQEEAGRLAVRETVLRRLQQPVPQRKDVALQGHQVGIGFAVEHHHVHRQAAEAPPGLGPEQGVQQGDAVVGVDAYQHDRLVAGEPEAPQLPLVHRPALGSHARRAVHQRGGEVLQRQDLFRHQPEVAHPDLRQCGCHAHGSLDVHRLQVAVDASREFFFALGSGRRKGQARHRTWSQPEPHPQAGDRVQSVDRRPVLVEGLGRQCGR